MPQKVIDESPLGLEIADLKKKYQEAKAQGERTGGAILYKTALRIARARQRFENEPLLAGKKFFQQFYIGFMSKKAAVFQVENDQWCGSFVPWDKFYGDTVEKVLKDMFGIKW